MCYDRRIKQRATVKAPIGTAAVDSQLRMPHLRGQIPPPNRHPLRPVESQLTRPGGQPPTANTQGRLSMSDLTNDETQALAKAVGLALREPELSQVAHSLNAILREMAAINPPDFNLEEYVAVVQDADLEDAV